MFEAITNITKKNSTKQCYIVCYCHSVALGEMQKSNSHCVKNIKKLNINTHFDQSKLSVIKTINFVKDTSDSFICIV